MMEGLEQLPVSDGTLCVLDTGGPGDVVVLLHPGNGSIESWAPQLAPLTAAGFRVVLYSRRGHLGSSPADSADPGVAAADLRELLEAKQITSAHVVGAAGGGIYAVDFALSSPHLVQSLTLVGSILGVTDADWRERIVGLGLEHLRALPAELMELGPSYRAEDEDGVAVWRGIHARAFIGGRLVQQSVATEINWAALAALTMPVLLVSGGADLMVPTPMVAYAAARISGAQHETIPDAGHAIAWERPEEFNRILVSFLRKETM